MIRIREVVPADSAAIAAIYNHFVSNTIITFEETPLSTEQIRQRIDTVTASYPWLAMEENGIVAGYAYGSPYRERRGYRFTVETTIYLDVSVAGKGHGTQLYSELMSRLSSGGFKTAVGVIALPNPASVRLHEKVGFKKVAHLQNAGWKFDQWIDTGYWQLQLS